MKNNDLGQMIRDARCAKGFTQREVSDLLGFQNSQFVYMIERGVSKAPLDVLGKLTEILGLDENEILRILTSQYQTMARTQLRAGKLAARKAAKRGKKENS